MKKCFWPGLLLCVSCGGNNTLEVSKPIVYQCGAENQVDGGGERFFQEDSIVFLGGDAQSFEKFFSGKFSAKLDSLQPYGMTLTLTDLEVGEYFTASVMTFDSSDAGKILAVLTDDSSYTLASECFNQDLDVNKGWRKHYLNFDVSFPVKEIKFFLFSNSNVCYFDDFTITRYPKRPKPESDAEPENLLRISIADADLKTLKDYQQQARKKGIISDDFKDYFPIHILRDNDSLAAEMRLKGDWTDHIGTGKASYRIKMSDSCSYNNLMSFSIQHPQTRNYLHEWFVHRWCEREGLLATRYDFVPVEINGEYWGIYALEEHFDKQVIESHHRREGPILKIDESGYWALLADTTCKTIGKRIPYYESATVTLFKENRTMKSEVLFNQFKNASILVERFKNFDLNPEDLFDLDQLAKYFAILDVANVHHALAWHNFRFYYNPVTAKLELIGFDMQPALEPKRDLNMLELMRIPEEKKFNEFMLERNLYASEKFRTLYFEYVRVFSSESYLDDLFSILSSEIETKEKVLALEYPDFQFDHKFYYDKARRNQSNLDSIARLSEFVPFGNKPYQAEVKEYTPHLDAFNQPDLGIKAWVSANESGKFNVYIENYHLNDVTLLGYSIEGAKDSLISVEKIQMKAFTRLTSMVTFETELSEAPERIHYLVSNDPGNVNKRKVFPWPKPSGKNPRTELEEKFNPACALYTIKGDSLFFKPGEWKIERLMYFPADYKVAFPAGSHFDFVTSGGFIFNNNVTMAGRTDNGITFTSSDTSSNGVTILNADTVVVRNVKMTNLSTLNYKGWQLTGAFTIYEGFADIDGLEISDNFCEDAFNTIRCGINVRNLSIFNTSGDAYDADFCNGIVHSSEIHHTYNDCIDFSGSIVDIWNMKLHHSGDKGVSAGEGSTLRFSDSEISDAVIGVASKDGAKLYVNAVFFSRMNFGAMTYTKKPEYDPSYLQIDDVTYSRVEQPGIASLGSVIVYNAKRYPGTLKIDVDALYARFADREAVQ